MTHTQEKRYFCAPKTISAVVSRKRRKEIIRTFSPNSFLSVRVSVEYKMFHDKLMPWGYSLRSCTLDL